MAALLQARNLRAFYAQAEVLHGIDFALNEGGITTILGANGAGKTTTLRAVCGMVRTQGEISFDARRIDGKRTEEIARGGIAHVPDGRGTFLQLTTEENLRLGAHSRRDRAGVARDLALVYDYFPRLKERLYQRGGTLSGGEQQMLAIARALMSRPKLLLLDEPSLGLAPLIVKQIFSIIRGLNETDGMTVFLVEQNAYHALKLAHRGYVMVNGNITMSGTGRELLADPQVQAAYLEGGHR